MTALGPFVMMLGMVVFWGGIILLIVWLVRGGFDRSRTPVVSAMEILERRFAEGAISVDEYREMAPDALAGKFRLVRPGDSNSHGPYVARFLVRPLPHAGRFGLRSGP